MITWTQEQSAAADAGAQVGLSGVNNELGRPTALVRKHRLPRNVPEEEEAESRLANSPKMTRIIWKLDHAGESHMVGIASWVG